MFELKRMRDGAGLIGDKIETFVVLSNEDGLVGGDKSGEYNSNDPMLNFGDIVKIGHFIKIYNNTDDWSVTRIAEKITTHKNYIKFKTEYSVYELSINN